MGYKENKELYERYAPWLIAQAQLCTPESVDYRDILHESFLRIAKGYRKKNFTDERALFAWMRRILSNTAIDEWRHHTKFQTIALLEEFPQVAEDIPGDDLIWSELTTDELLPLLERVGDKIKLVAPAFLLGGDAVLYICHVVRTDDIPYR